MRQLSGRSALDASVDYFADQRALVVVDNCEHVLETAAEVAEALLHGCPEVTVLATSRAPLGVGGETDWRVPSLSLPPERAPAPIDVVTQSDAVRLFIDRAGKVRPNFAVNAQNAPAIAQICHDLDGIPLAIELAAARVRVLSPDQIAAGLGDRFRLLTGGARSAMPRQQTLRASVDWSHKLLSDQERVLFRRLAVFAGGWTLDAVERVCAGDGIDAYAILDLLTSLVDKSLVVADEGRIAVRYRMLETVRDYALDLLRESGELDPLCDRHRDFFLVLAETAEPKLDYGDRAAVARDARPRGGERAAAHRAGRRQPTPNARCDVSRCSAPWWKARGHFAAAELGLRPRRSTRPIGHHRRCGPEFCGAAPYLLDLRGRLHCGDRHRAASAYDGGGGRGRICDGSRTEVLETFSRLLPDPVGSRDPTSTRAIELARSAGDDWCFYRARSEISVTRTCSATSLTEGERLRDESLAHR